MPAEELKKVDIIIARETRKAENKMLLLSGGNCKYYSGIRRSLPEKDRPYVFLHEALSMKNSY
jgi:hypothetical protein